MKPWRHDYKKRCVKSSLTLEKLKIQREKSRCGVWNMWGIYIAGTVALWEV